MKVITCDQRETYWMNRYIENIIVSKNVFYKKDFVYKTDYVYQFKVTKPNNSIYLGG